MPCNSDYLNPTNREMELQRAAKLLLYVCKAMKLPIPPYASKAANNMYCTDDRSVMKLCDILHELSPEAINIVVYDAKNKTARDLADWWEEHQEADRKRELEEAETIL